MSRPLDLSWKRLAIAPATTRTLSVLSLAYLVLLLPRWRNRARSALVDSVTRVRPVLGRGPPHSMTRCLIAA